MARDQIEADRVVEHRDEEIRPHVVDGTLRRLQRRVVELGPDGDVLVHRLQPERKPAEIDLGRHELEIRMAIEDAARRRGT